MSFLIIWWCIGPHRERNIGINNFRIGNHLVGEYNTTAAVDRDKHAVFFFVCLEAWRTCCKLFYLIYLENFAFDWHATFHNYEVIL